MKRFVIVFSFKVSVGSKSPVIHGCTRYNYYSRDTADFQLTIRHFPFFFFLWITRFYGQFYLFHIVILFIIFCMILKRILEYCFNAGITKWNEMTFYLCNCSDYADFYAYVIVITYALSLSFYHSNYH